MEATLPRSGVRLTSILEQRTARRRRTPDAAIPGGPPDNKLRRSSACRPHHSSAVAQHHTVSPDTSKAHFQGLRKGRVLNRALPYRRYLTEKREQCEHETEYAQQVLPEVAWQPRLSVAKRCRAAGGVEHLAEKRRGDAKGSGSITRLCDVCQLGYLLGVSCGETCKIGSKSEGGVDGRYPTGVYAS